MKKFQIPESYLPGLRVLSELNEDEMSSIYMSLKQMPEGTGPKTFKNMLKEAAKVEDVDSLASALFSFGGLLTEEAVDIQKLANDFVDSFLISIGQQFSDEQRKKYLERIVTLFSLSDAAKTTFKVYSVIEDNNNIFTECRILSDVRLLFENDLANQKDKKGIIIHRLKLNNRNNGKYEDSYFSLDIEDLRKLKQQVERAIEKETLIKKEYVSSINFIQLSE